MDTAGDGFFATFDGPARAIRCAAAIANGAKDFGLDARAGLHTGECEVMGAKVGGIAVHIGARVAAMAEPVQYWCPIPKDLVAGSGLEFEERGTHTLKGVPGEWRLYAATALADSLSPADSSGTLQRFRFELSPHNARALAHRIMQAGPFLLGRVREDDPHEEDRRH